MTATDKHAQPETYNLLRAALVLFKKTPADLGEAELKRVRVQAINEYKIENLVLNTPEASTVIITEQELQIAYREIRERYDNDEALTKDLEKNRMDQDSLMAALRRQCKVNTVLELVASRTPPISDSEIGIYYHLHPDQFNRPERREACHIYISINPDYPENVHDVALARAQEIAEKLKKKPHKFADLALKHSECPTSLQGGTLGSVPRGKLYPELDAALFTMKPGEISGVIQSEIGFHVLMCKDIQKAETMSLEKATPKIRQLLTDRARRNNQRAWIAGLANPDAGDAKND